MPIRLSCPSCKAIYSLGDQMVGKQVRCKQCQKVFQVGAPKPAVPVVDAVLVDNDPPPPTPPAKSIKNQPGRVSPPAKTAPQPRDDDPVPPPRKKGSAFPFIIIGGVLAVLLLMCGGGGIAIIGAIIYFADSGPTPVVANNVSTKSTAFNPPVENNPGPIDPSATKPANPPPTRPRPTRPMNNPPVNPPDNPPVNPPVNPPMNPPVDVNHEAVKLPAPANDVVVGGAGRYLIFVLPSIRKLSVFDYQEKKLTGSVSLPEENVKIAAGLDKLFVFLPRGGQLQRWDLATLKKEATVSCSAAAVRAVAMGSAAQGPLVVYGRKLEFYDPATLKALNVRSDLNLDIHVRGDSFGRVSANGQVFGHWVSQGQGATYLTFEGTSVKWSENRNSSGHVCPSPDGSVIYTARGLFAFPDKPLGEAGRDAPYCIPADQGPFFIGVISDDPFGGMARPGGPKPKGKVALHSAGDPRPLLALPQVALPSHINQWDREPFGNDKRFHFNAAAKLLITIPDTNDHLVLHPLDVEAELKKANTDYLYVVSQPPGLIKQGQKFSYPIVVKSSKGGVKFQLENGPKGLQVGADGMISWAVPADYAERDTLVTVGISDAGDQQLLHTFKVLIRGESGEVVKSALPAKTDPDKPVKLADHSSTLPVPEVNGWVMAPDGVNLMITSLEELIWIDTVTEKETNRVKLPFKPSKMAQQGSFLYVIGKGSGLLYQLEVATGKVVKEIKVADDSLVEVACHPLKGLVYVTDGKLGVFAVDPMAGTSMKTKAQGMFLAVDPIKGDHVYTAIQGLIRDVITIKEVGGTMRITGGLEGDRTLMLRYAVKGNTLEPVGSNNNAAQNGRLLRLSPDGKRIAVVGGGGYRPPSGGTGNFKAYGIAIFNPEDMKAMQGVVDVGAYPSDIAFHPVLELGVAEQAGGNSRLTLFDGKSLTERASATLPGMKIGSSQHLLTFGAKGTKLLCFESQQRSELSLLHFANLPLTDQDKAALDKAYPK